MNANTLTDRRFGDLEGVVLDGADLRGADLSGCRLRRTSLRGAMLDGADLRSAKLEQVDLEGASLRGVSLAGAVVRICSLVDANLDGADLSNSHVVYSVAEGASLRGALMEGAITVGSTFARADLTGCRRYATCRELVLEVLLRAGAQDLATVALMGVVAIRRDWCYGAWRRILAKDPAAMRFAIETFSMHPASGVLDALRGARAPAASPAERLLDGR